MKCFTAKIIIPIQSISDVITNSSSEIFCSIFSDTHLNDIYKFLKGVISEGYNEDSMYMNLIDKDEDYLDDYYKDYPNKWIEINLPYSSCGMEDILRVGLTAILDGLFKDNYKIIFE